ncbi:MAG: alpha-L-rhamnosidase N-terminal domain-containing protein, partial [Muribaculaceae bacterium]|nr:alpha-L-rhamnosidase N-terminal domain-containing protein [Muribaculaceae bacterium]
MKISGKHHIIAAAAIITLAACGSRITRIFMPESVGAGESFPVVVELDIDTKGSLNPAGDSYGNFAIRLPKGWRVETGQDYTEAEIKDAYEKLYFREQYVSDLLTCPVMPVNEGETAESIYEECKEMGTMTAYIYPKSDATTPMLRNRFDMPADAEKKARVIAHVNSLGYHELYVNGVKVGSDVLQPAVSRLDKRSLIVSYDITDLVTPADNDVVIRLGRGWYRQNTYNAEHEVPVVKACIDYVCGRNVEHLIATGSEWTVAETGYRDTGAWQ